VSAFSLRGGGQKNESKTNKRIGDRGQTTLDFTYFYSSLVAG